jgi:hypothetical protein
MKIPNALIISSISACVLLPAIILMMQRPPSFSDRTNLGMASPVDGAKSQATGYSQGKPAGSSGIWPEIERHNLAGKTPAPHSRRLRVNGLGSEPSNTPENFEESDQHKSAKAISPGSIGSGETPGDRTSVVTFQNSVPSGAQISAVAPLAVQEVPHSLVETSLELSVPSRAPLPAVVAASLESAAAETVPSQSSARVLPGMDGILSDYVVEAERPAPPEGRLEQARTAAESANERFRMLYGHDAYLKYIVDAARLSLQESK